MIQAKEGPRLRSMSREMHTRFDTLMAERGNILNEDGIPLSASMPQFDVHVDFSVIDSALFEEKIDSVCWNMARLFRNKKKTAAQYKHEFVRAYDHGSKYYLVGRKLKYYEYEAMRNFPIFNKGKAVGGFIVEPIEKRQLPYRALARRTIGIFRSHHISGLEAMYNSELIGENGRRVVQKATGGVWIPIEGSEIEPQNGRDIVTTLDMDVQDVAHHALLKILEKYECEYGTCIVMEVATGKIRTLVNLGRQKNGSYYEDYNYATIPTEPGSTFKLVTLISLLNDKKINVEQLVDAEGGMIQFHGRTMRDSHLGLHKLPIWEAFAESSNAAMAKLAETYYADNPGKFVDHLKQLQLDRPTGIDLLGERRSVVIDPNDKRWNKVSLPWMATGYGVMITPLHTCMLYNAVANNGKMMKPYLVSSIQEYGKDVKKFSPVVVAKIGDSATVAQLRKCTRAVVTEGTAKGIESPYYTMAGKTGTAQVADKGIKYSDGVYHGSFVGYLPAENPKYTICVVVRTKPKSKAYYGGTVAAPVFRMVADKIFSQNMGAWSGPLDSMAKEATPAIPAKTATASTYELLLKGIHKDIPVKTDYRYTMVQLQTDTNLHTDVVKQKVYRDVMPDVLGMTLKDAVYILETYGMHVNVKGAGRVQAQSVPQGTKLEKGQKILLKLS